MMHDDKATAIEIDNLVSLENKKVLEIGCGNGRVTAYLVHKPQQLVAIDPDVARLQIANDQFVSVMFVAGEGERLPFDAHTFDVILFTLSLHIHSHDTNTI